MKDRIALVTGGGRGIGRATAIGLAAGGARVAVTARTASQLDEVLATIDAAGGSAVSVAADLSDPDAPSRIVEAVGRALGPVDILVNNAGVGSSASPRPLVDFDDEFWELSLRVNVTAPYRLTRLVLPGMIERGYGRIINVASINARVPSVHGAAYTASKHALVGLTKATALEVGPHGVTANAVCPGVTATAMNDRRLEHDAERLGTKFEDLEARASPLGRRLVPEEVASMAVYLASDAANAVNGQSINVCGGVVYS